MEFLKDLSWVLPESSDAVVGFMEGMTQFQTLGLGKQ